MDLLLSFGVGGNVPSRTRGDDTFGIGWYHASTSSQIGDGQGVECFYNYELTPAARIAPDMQYVVPAPRAAAPALIVGMRALVSF